MNRIGRIAGLDVPISGVSFQARPTYRNKHASNNFAQAGKSDEMNRMDRIAEPDIPILLIL